MAIDQDPYRTLGLSRGASIEEIKRAYRRLAKIHHPDAAGEKNVPRFLAIQAAYEQLAGGADGRSVPRRPAAPRKAWEADSDRTDATRRAYGGRARGPASGSTSSGAGGAQAKGAGAGPGPAPGAGPAAGPRPRPSSTRSGRRGMGGAGAAGTSGPAGSGGAGADSGTSAGAGTDAGKGAGTTGTPPRSGGTRKRNKATLGSTSYDGVDGPFEPDWRGASWYGTTSGTYWTLNPKEYADPRKHGPEYQARARRAAHKRAAGSEPTGAPDPLERDEATPGPEAAGAPQTPDPQPAAGPTHTTSSWWESTAGATEPPPADTASTARPVRASSATPPPLPPDIGRALGDIGRALTEPAYGGRRGRLARAVIGWLPIAFGLSWLAGEITGCGRFSATCNGAADPIVLILVLATLLLLLALPVVASIAAMGAVTLLSGAVAAAFALSATGEAADSDSRRAALGAVLLLSWLAGIGVAVAKRVRAPVSTTRPVS